MELAFDALEGRWRVGLRRLISRVPPSAGSCRVRSTDRAAVPPFPVAAERQVDGDPVNPRIERTFSMKLVELLEGPHERVLEYVLGVLGGAQEPHDGRVQTILVPADQDAECLGLALAACLHKAVVVMTPGHQSLGRFHRGGGSQKVQSMGPTHTHG